MRVVRWVVPALLVLLWLALGAAGSPFLGKLSEVQSNDPGSFLPATAESTAVTELQENFADSRILPTVVVFERPGGLTAADNDAIRAKAAELADAPELRGQPSPPLPADDGQAAQLILPLSGEDPFAASEAVKDIRQDLERGLPGGLTALVTGPGGYNADFAEVFGHIDGMLLLVTACAVAVILILVYRSPLLPLIVLLSAGLALCTSSAVIYWLASDGALVLNGQTQGILLILVFGAATDYALLLVARYREELTRQAKAADAMRTAWRSSFEPILASGGTVILGMLCMLVSELTSNSSLGPVVSIGIAGALLASLTFLPAALLLFGRAGFWPQDPVPRKHRRTKRGMFDSLAGLVRRRPRWTWVLTALVLFAGVAFVPSLQAEGTSQQALFLEEVDAVRGQDVLSAHFPGGTGSPAVIIADANAADEVLAATRATDGVADAFPTPADPVDPAAGPKVAGGVVEINATLQAPADSEEAVAVVGALRDTLHDIPGADAKVGGQTAQQTDMLAAATHDRNAIIPIVLVVIFAVLALLLRSLLAPLLLIATVVLSFGATLGVGALMFNDVFGFPGADPAIPLYAFVFLVALGIDYNIFLMTRAREETALLGTEAGTLSALRVTGGVITSAGVVLAATFAALAVIPVLFLAQIAFLVAFGVLLDTFVVRSLLVPALAVDLGRIIWWPSRLAARPKAEQRKRHRPNRQQPRPERRPPPPPQRGQPPRPPRQAQPGAASAAPARAPHRGERRPRPPAGPPPSRR
ncbi:putative drug exporter of the RND superfamily [Amycolatopsis marina]|uniref:Putative drug exporter of the RND superfamily n=1 Tax=Amycolatopsis marina TaxID=490629 RepID=A0A1I1CCJ0_9PSEU|nr:MMPL family transporter [Amycolatopsis marina]SFB58480.1 putative drug exporter of the RND superfamily [Amycolatopsis marina]